MEKVVIDKKRDTIIVEKSSGNNILKDSKLFCGCCGEKMGVLSETISFPFNSAQLNSVVEDKSYEESKFGLRHKTCGHTMFTFRLEYGFITLEKYLKETAIPV